MLLLNDPARDAHNTDAPLAPHAPRSLHVGIRLYGAEAVRAAERVIDAITEHQLDLEMQLQVVSHSVANPPDANAPTRFALDLGACVAEVAEVTRALAILRQDADDPRMATMLAPGEPLVAYVLYAYAWCGDALLALDAVARGGPPPRATVVPIDHDSEGRAIRFALTQLPVNFDDASDPLHGLRGHIERLLWTLAIARRDLDRRLRGTE
jgi:hypothetical protein